jgi:hypothetical protein
VAQTRKIPKTAFSGRKIHSAHRSSPRDFSGEQPFLDPLSDDVA